MCPPHSSASSHVGWAGLVSPADKHLLAWPPHRSLNYITHLQAPLKSFLEGPPDLSLPSPCEGHCEVNSTITPCPPPPYDPLQPLVLTLWIKAVSCWPLRPCTPKISVFPLYLPPTLTAIKSPYLSPEGFFSPHTMSKTQKILLSQSISFTIPWTMYINMS